MSNYHRPRTFRSLQGCCICGAKSSSSRFTDSDKYEADFALCFKVEKGRKGDICNACVLLVKRWKKLPRGSRKDWSHVVDAKTISGNCHKTANSTLKHKTRSIKDDPDVKAKKIIKKRAVSAPHYQPSVSPDSDNRSHNFCASPNSSESSVSTDTSKCPSDSCVSSFLDLSYWKRTKVCCGEVFIGENEDLVIDVSLYRPCSAHSGTNSSHSRSSVRSRTDTSSSHGSSAEVSLVDPTGENVVEMQPPKVKTRSDAISVCDVVSSS